MSVKSAPRINRPWEQKRSVESSSSGDGSKSSDVGDMKGNIETSTSNLSTAVSAFPKPHAPTVPATFGLGFGSSLPPHHDVTSPLPLSNPTNPSSLAPAPISPMAPSPFALPAAPSALRPAPTSLQRYTELLTLALQSMQSLLANTMSLTQRIFLLKMELSAILKSFALLRVGYSAGAAILSWLKRVLSFPFSLHSSSSMDSAWHNACSAVSPHVPRRPSSSILSRIVRSVDAASVAAIVLVAWALSKLHATLQKTDDCSQKSNQNSSVSTAEQRTVYDNAWNGTFS